MASTCIAAGGVFAVARPNQGKAAKAPKRAGSKLWMPKSAAVDSPRIIVEGDKESKMAGLTELRKEVIMDMEDFAENEVSAEVRGRELMSGLPKTVVLTPEEVRAAIDEPVTAMVDSVLSCLAQAPPELAQDLIVEGVHLVGGGGLLRGMDVRLTEESDVPVHLVEAPLEAVVIGAGRVIEHYESVQAMFMDGSSNNRRR